MSELSAKNAKIDIWGRAVIHEGTTKIMPWAFDRNKSLRSISVPGTVKQIGDRAFADCVNLKTVHLEEGIEIVGSNVFTGCSSLTELTLPDSIRQLDGWAFYRFTGLQRPAYNRSRTILYCYPCTAQEKVFRVPDTILRVNPAAFIKNPYLEEVILPKGLKVLESRTFVDCDLQRITIPETVTKIEYGAFFGCKLLKDIYVLGENTQIEMGAFTNMAKELRIHLPKERRFDEQLRLRGISFLRQASVEAPEERYWESADFIKKANGIGNDAESMWDFGNYLLSLGSGVFYECAANFWRYRACQKGHTAAEKWFLRWLEEHPGKVMGSTMNESMSGYYAGKVLNGMGFLFFDPERSYKIEKPNADGVVVVSAWCSEDGPDEDGFGREEYYDWWLLDEALKPIPEIPMWHEYSGLDMRMHEQKWNALTQKAGEIIRNMKAAESLQKQVF